MKINFYFGTPSSENISIYLILPTLIKYSAICTAFNAAPFLIWSPTIQNVNPFSLLRSLRMRPT